MTDPADKLSAWVAVAEDSRNYRRKLAEDRLRIAGARRYAQPILRAVNSLATRLMRWIEARAKEGAQDVIDGE